MKNIYSLILILALLLGWWFSLAQDGLWSVSHIVWIDSILQRGTVTRYEMSNFLNLANCKDCTNPTKDQLERFSEQRRDDAKQIEWNNIDDIVLGKQFFEWNEYSICVAEVVDTQLMTWFPKTTSPFCPWRFCGTNTLTRGDFTQAIIKFYGSDLYSLATINRLDFQTWIEENGVVLDESSTIIVDEALSTCAGTNCSIRSAEEFDLYTKYCRNNLRACWMQSTSWLWESDVSVVATNILFDLNLVKRETIDELWRFDAIPSNVFLDIMDSLIRQSNCQWSDDEDDDWVVNDEDNCAFEYNPRQKDMDRDAMWDVCDYDIDGDGILNIPWVVDDDGNLYFQRIWDSADNCILTPNPDQDDRDYDGIWNACDTDGKSLANPNAWEDLEDERLTSWSLSIKANVTQWSPPLLVDFEAISDSDFTEIQWYFGDGSWSKKSSPDHVFSQDGIWTVRAVATFADGSKAAAKQSIHVKWWESSFVAFEAKAEPLTGKIPLEVNFQHVYQWELDTVVWTIGDEEVWVQAWQDYLYIFENEWMYEVLAQWYRLSQLVAQSRVSVDVLADTAQESQWRSALLQAKDLLIPQGQDNEFVTVLEGFEEEDILRVTWNIWEYQIATLASNYNYRFAQSWPTLIKQTIEFKDWYPALIQEMTVYVVPSEWDWNPPVWARLEIDKSLVQVWEEVKAEILLEAWDPNSIRSIRRMRDDRSLDTNELEQIMVFEKSGSRRIVAHVVTNAWELLIMESTINVLWNSACVTNDWFCDFDEDGIVDQCDDDIDGDGVANLLGILIWENDACRFTKWVIDLERLQDQISRIKTWEPFDNCPFSSNSSQEDADEDAYGDACDSQPWENDGEVDEDEKDTDGDWIIDKEDACPKLAENLNGKEDADGCPELWWWGWSSSSWGSWGSGNWNGSNWWGFGGWWGLGNNWDSYLEADECYQCPCPKADFASQLMPWDRVKAVLVDPSEEKVYSHSAPKLVR